MKYFLPILAGCVLVGSSLLFFMRSSAITNVPSDGTSIVAFGDSLVQGVGASEGNDFVSILSGKIGEPIINLGNSGDTTRDALSRIDTVLVQDPKVVIVLLGGNDYLKKIPEEETFANLEEIIETIHDSGSSVLVLGVRGGILRDNFKASFKDLSKKHTTGYVSDVLAGLLGNPKMMSDSIHPNDAGYSSIAERVYPELQELLE